MIQVKHVSKEFVSPKKYPGFKGAIKGLFSNEKVSKKAVDDISFTIEKGEIVEQGTHEELMALQGHYHNLFTTQAKRYISSTEENDE